MGHNRPEDVRFIQTPEPMTTCGEFVRINVAASFAPRYFRRNAVVVFQPELQHEGGTVQLRPVVLIGERVTNVQGAIIPRVGGRFAYIDYIPFTPELEDARLVVSSVILEERRARGIEGLNAQEALQRRGARATEPVTIATGIITLPQDQDVLADAEQQDQDANLAYVELQETILVEPGDDYSIDREMYRLLSLGSNVGIETERVFVKSALFFEIGLSNVDMNHYRNQKEEFRLARETKTAYLRSGKEIAMVRILGWASPEGNEALNIRLGIERARAGDRFFREQYARDIRQSFPIVIEYMGEDWDGFMVAVSESNLRNRVAIRTWFERNTDRVAREQELRRLIAIHPEFQREILPPLRRVEKIIEFVVVSE